MTIPERVQEGLAKLQDLSPESADSLLNALQNAQPSLRHKPLADAVALQLPSSDRIAIVEIVRSVLSISHYRQTFDKTVQETVSDVMSSEDFTITNENKQIFEKRLNDLLGVEALCITSKANDILTNHQNVLVSAQIVTDVRPIFKDNPTATPTAALIIHTLKVTYRQDREKSDFFVALDTEDLADLRKAIDRAEAKAESLKKVLGNAKLSYLEVNHEI